MVEDGWRSRVAGLVSEVGYAADAPLVVGVQPAGEPPVLLAQGSTLDGRPLTPTTLVYGASLAKQVTGTCAALLVREGRLSLDTRLTDWVPELPAWAQEVRVRHLLWHTSGLPEVCSWDELDAAGADRTTPGVLHALIARDGLDSPPGSEHRYANVGYVCLALVLGRVAGRPFADLAQERVLAPLGLTGSRFFDGPDPQPPGAAPLDPPHPAPLSLGDGGLWWSASDLLRWNRALARDALGVADLVEAPGRLDDGTPLDYAWGVGVRERAGRRVLRHGGLWAGVNAQLVRVEDGPGLVVVALDLDEVRTGVLVEHLLDALLD